MKTIFIALLKSFWLAKGKLLLCILAAVLSAWGISTMIYSYWMTERDFEENFTKSNPADLVITLKGAPEEGWKAIQRHESVRVGERREVINARIRNRSGNWMTLILFAVENVQHPKLNTFTHLEGPGKASGEIFIERNGAGFLKEYLDSVSVQLVGEKVIDLSVAGLVHDPGQAPSQMEQAVYGYIQINLLESYFPQKQQRFLVQIDESVKEEAALKVLGQQLAALAESKGCSATVVVPPPGEHPHQNIVNGISFLQRSFGSILAALGVILLSLMLITWLYPQLPVIGIMKAMGAPNQVIFQAYLSVFLMLLVLGMLVGLPLGYRTAQLYSGSVAFIQNFTAIRTPLPVYSHFFAILPALLIPLAVGWVPLKRVTRTTVQDALSHIFYTPFRSVFLWSQKALVDVRWKYSVNNLFRSNQRTVLVAVLLISGVALYGTGVNLRRSLKEDFAAYADEAGYGVTLVLKDSAQQRFAFVEKLPFVEATAYIRVQSVRFRLPEQSYDERSAIRMLPPEYQLNVNRITKGALNPSCSDCIFVSQRYQTDFEKIPLGSNIELKFQDDRVRTFTYSGVVKDISHPGFYWPRKEENSSFNEIAIRTKRSVSTEEATRLLDDAFLENDIDVRQLSDITTRLAALENHLAPMYLVIQVMGVATILIALVGLGIVLSLSIQERSREIGIMKAMGGSVTSIIGTYQREYTVITTASILIGLLVGYFFNAAICNLFGVMVINAPVPPLIDLTRVGVMIMVLLMVQILLIDFYVRYKLKRSSSSLLTEIL